MDIYVAILLALQQAAFGVLAIVVPLKYQLRFRYTVIVFGTLALSGIGLVCWQAVLAHQSNAETRKAQIGDAQHPPYIATISLPNDTRFVTVNASDYPAYTVQIRLYGENNKAVPIRRYGPSEIAAHTAITDDQTPWTVNDNLEHRFTAEISTRSGTVREELLLRPAGNNQWMMACRILNGMMTLPCQADSNWPRDDKGQPIFD